MSGQTTHRVSFQGTPPVCQISFDTASMNMVKKVGTSSTPIHDFKNNYLEIFMDLSNDTTRAAGERDVIVKEMDALPTGDYLEFRIKQAGSPPILKIVRTTNTDAGVWYMGIGTDDVRVQRSIDVGAGILNIEHTHGPILHYNNTDQLFEIYYRV